MHPPTLIPREEVAKRFGVSSTLLAQYEAHGFVRAVSTGNLVGYEPQELRRLWTVLSLHRDAGINLAGVECVLRLREHFDALQARMLQLADQLREIVEEESHDDGP